MRPFGKASQPYALHALSDVYNSAESHSNYMERQINSNSYI